jgi:hypothetical protein
MRTDEAVLATRDALLAIAQCFYFLLFIRIPLSPAEKSDQQTHSLTHSHTHSLTLLTTTHFTVHNFAQASQHNTLELLAEWRSATYGWLVDFCSTARHCTLVQKGTTALHRLHWLHWLHYTAQWWLHINNTTCAMYISSPLSSSVPNDSSSLDTALSSLLPIILRVRSAVQCSAVQVA